MTTRRLPLALAVLVLLGVGVVGSTACYPTIRTCDWRASVKATMKYRPAPLAPRFTGAETRVHNKWRTSGWDPRCQGVSVYDMRRGVLGEWNLCYANPLVQGTVTDACNSSTYNEPSGAYGLRWIRGLYHAGDAYWFMDGSGFHQVGHHRPDMDCYFATAGAPSDIEVSCPWVVVVPGKGNEGGNG